MVSVKENFYVANVYGRRRAGVCQEGGGGVHVDRNDDRRRDHRDAFSARRTACEPVSDADPRGGVTGGSEERRNRFRQLPVDDWKVARLFGGHALSERLSSRARGGSRAVPGRRHP